MKLRKRFLACERAVVMNHCPKRLRPAKTEACPIAQCGSITTKDKSPPERHRHPA